MSKMKQSTDKSSQEPCNYISSNEFFDQTKYLETNKDISINAEVVETELLREDASDDNRSHSLKDTNKGDSNDRATIEAADSKTTDHEVESDDEYWDTLTHVEENELFQENDSSTDEETFWDCLTELEEIAETDMPEKEKQEIKIRPESESVWDNQHINDTIKTVPKLSKENKSK